MKYLNLFLIILSTGLSLLTIYTGIIFYNFINYSESENKFFQNKEIMEFHKKYSSKLNHTRGTDNSVIFDLLIENHKLSEEDLVPESNSKIMNKNELLFNYIHKTNNKRSILLQGDSWIEQFNFYKKSNEELIKFAAKKDVNIINAGVSSFSPTLMRIQFDILKQDFEIKPEIVVAMFDQTDIGDEICRYKNNRIFKKNKVIGVSPAFNRFPIKWKLAELYFDGSNKKKRQDLFNISFILLN